MRSSTVAEIGPLPSLIAPAYLLRINEASGPPGTHGVERVGAGKSNVGAGPVIGEILRGVYNDDMEAAAIGQALREFFAAEPGEIIAAYLFGSVARGTAGAQSDVDVAVLYTDAPPATIEGLPLDLERRIGRRVGRLAQVVVLNAAPVSLIHRVLRDGVLLLDRAPSARIRFEVKARNEYFDLQHILARYRRQPVPAP